MDEKDKWIEDVFSVETRINRASLPDHLKASILAIPERIEESTISVRTIWFAAASIAVLIAFNFWGIISNESTETTKSGETEFVSTYFSHTRHL